MSNSDAVSAFSSLDELIQVIYQGSSRFVVLSSTDDTSWRVRLGLSDSNGRWWEGRWGEEEIRKAGVRPTLCLLAKLTSNYPTRRGVYRNMRHAPSRPSGIH